MSLSNGLPNTIKQIVHDVIVVSAGQLTATKTIAAVDVTKTELRNMGVKSGDSGSYALVELTNATTVTAYRSGSPANALTVGFEFTERW